MTDDDDTHEVLSKREIFAVIALNGLMVCDVLPNEGQRPAELRAELAVKHADALLAALKEPPA